MAPSFAVRALALAALALPSTAQKVLWTFTGVTGDEYGAAVIKTGDQNNDGYPDVLVGAPGWNGGRGYVRAVSGKFLATGQGSTTLWTLYSTANAGARFGSSLAEVATLTGNSATDYMIGAPGYAAGLFTTGALMLVDGSTHTVASTITGETNVQFGGSVVAVGDQDGDGKIDVAASAIPLSSTNNNSKVHVVPGSAFTAGSHSLTSVTHWTRSGGWHDYGASLSSGFDLDHDGRFDLAVGLPTYGFSFPGSGYVEVLRPDSSMFVLGAYTPLSSGSHFGTSVDAKYDVNGDGYVDLVVGAPGFDPGVAHEVGRAAVISGARLLNPNAGPIELFDIRFSSIQTTHFGQCVRAVSDLNHDGVADFLVGMPDYFTIIPPGSRKGGAQIFSGKTGERMGSLVGQTHDNLGDALLELSMDIDHDGFDDFAVGGSLSDNSTTDCGTLKYFSLYPAASSTYCTSKINSQGCGPWMNWSGSASVSSTSPFTIQCFAVLNQVSGLMIYGHQPVAAPFQGGYLCVNTPLARTLVESSGGNVGAPDCSGMFTYDFNALVQSGVDPTLVAGSEMFFQYWSRDPASPSTTNLSNALRAVIGP